ncbi:hypothetical protein ACOMHN_034852 [Nucella lapillus]
MVVEEISPSKSAGRPKGKSKIPCPVPFPQYTANNEICSVEAGLSDDDYDTLLNILARHVKDRARNHGDDILYRKNPSFQNEAPLRPIAASHVNERHQVDLVDLACISNQQESPDSTLPCVAMEPVDSIPYAFVPVCVYIQRGGGPGSISILHLASSSI